MHDLRIAAEAIAWPFCAPAGLLSGGQGLDPAALRPGFAIRAGCHGPDELAIDAGEACWGPRSPWAARRGGGDGGGLLDYLRYWSGRLLWIDGDHARLRADAARPLTSPGAGRSATSPDRPGREVLAWRFLSLRLPAELLLAGLAAEADDTGCAPRRVALLPPLLRFSRPTAHLHAHHGQVSASAQVWAGLPGRFIGWLRDPSKAPPGPMPGEPLAEALQTDDPGTKAPRPSSRRLSWVEVMLRAKVIEQRMMLHFALHEGAFGPCCACWRGEPEAALGAHELLTMRAEAEQEQPARARTNLRLEALLSRGLPELAERGRAPDALVTSPHTGTQLLQQALRAAARSGDSAAAKTPGQRADETLEKALCQLLRVRTLLHQALTMDPSRPGLRSFREDYEGPAERYTGPPLTGEAFSRRIGAQHLQVAAIEVRTAPGSDRVNPLDTSIQHVHQRKPGAPEFGWVPHLSRSFDALRGVPPGPDRTRRCFESLHQTWQRAQLLVQRVQHAERSGQRPTAAIRGIDLCGEEREGPLWMFAPILARLREALDQAARRDGLPAPGLTLHCGESFAHLLTGLRAVHEPLSRGLWRQGDRLGHALALGVSPKVWVQRRPVVAVRALDRLFDLSWLRANAGPLGITLSADDLLRVDLGIAEAKATLGLPQRSPPAADGAPDCAYAASHHLAVEDYAPLTAPVSASQAPHLRRRLGPLLDLARDGHLDGGAFIEVETAPELALLRATSKTLAAHLAANQVTIEVNPTSNLLVGALHSPLDQPRFWRRGLKEGARTALPLCLSADDPLAFATELEDEVAYAWAGMVVAGGLSASFARGWIDDALAVAYQARFTLADGATGAE